MHSSRPLPLPWSNPAKLADLRAPFHAAKTTAARSVSVRDADKIFLLGIKSKIKFAAVKQCEDSEKIASVLNELAEHSNSHPSP
jgi:hypothetical protein